MRKYLVFIVVLLIVIMGVVSSFMIYSKNDRIEAQQAELEATQKRQVAVAAAAEQFRIVRSLTVTGDQASVAENQIMGELRGVDLNFGAIGSSEAEVARFVVEAYARDAHKALAALKGLKANPEAAKTLQAEFFRCVDRSEKSLASFVPNANVIGELVARNYIGAAKAQGARVSASSLRQQGVAVGKAPTVRKKPTAKKAAPKPAKRPTPARRR